MATPPPDPRKQWPTRLQIEPYDDWQRDRYDSDGNAILGITIGLLFTWAVAATVVAVALAVTR